MTAGAPAKVSGDPTKTHEAKPGENDPQQQSYPGHDSEMRNKPDYGYDTYKGSGKLLNKIALITGGDSGIGRAVALAFSREGANVAIAYLPEEEEDAQETKRVVEEAGRKALLLPGDLSQQATIDSHVAKTVEAFERIDILVNNAAVQLDAKDFLEMDRERVEKTVSVNILGYFFMAQKCVPHMPRGSCIIQTSSIQSKDPSPYIVDYAMTKGAISTMTQGLSQALLSSKGIRVNAVAPGPVWTPLIVESFPEEKVKAFGSQAPIQRAAQPREYGAAYVFLASNADSSYVSGEVLAVTGGMLLT